MDFREIPIEPPLMLTMAEIMEISGYSKSTIVNKAWQGSFPKPLFSNRRYGRVYNGEEVYKALGILRKVQTEQKEEKGFEVF